MLEMPLLEVPMLEVLLLEAPLLEAPLLEVPMLEVPMLEVPMLEVLLLEAPLLAAPPLRTVPLVRQLHPLSKRHLTRSVLCQLAGACMPTRLPQGMPHGLRTAPITLFKRSILIVLSLTNLALTTSVHYWR